MLGAARLFGFLIGLANSFLSSRTSVLVKLLIHETIFAVMRTI